MIAFLLALSLSGQTPPAPLSPNANCQICHFAGNTVTEGMANDTHRGSLMALAGVDPFFLAAWEIASSDDAEVAALCASCHFPGATLAGRRPTSFSLQPDVATDLDGIACDLCHRMEADLDASGAPIFDSLMGNAGFRIGPLEPKVGPYGDGQFPGHLSSASPLSGRSETCGQCHDVTNETRDRFGTPGMEVSGPVPLERTFREWQQSSFGRAGPGQVTCQGCHMPNHIGRAASGTSSPADRLLSSHRIVGSTTRAPRMIALYPQVFGSAAPIVTLGITEAAEASAVAALTLLRGATSLEALVSDSKLLVRVTNYAGHKLPTGYAEGRRMWLEVARVDNDDCVSLGGAWNAETCARDDGLEAPRTWEAIMGEQGEKSFHFALVDTIIKDNRIPPAGFVPDADTAPVGTTFPLVPGPAGQNAPAQVMANWDDVPIDDWQPGNAPVTYEARIIFQSTTSDFLRFLVDGAPEGGAILQSLFLAAGPYQPEEIGVLRFTIDEQGQVENLVGSTQCLSNLIGPPEPCLGLPVAEPETETETEPPVLEDTIDDSPPEQLDGCRCLRSQASPSGGSLAFGGLAFVLVRMRHRRHSSLRQRT